jgi:DNA modification methylase
MIIRKMEISSINPAAYNPRKDLQPGDPEYEKLKRSIQEFDIVEPLIWNERTGNLVGGHQRLKVLQDLGYTEVEVSVVDMDSAKEKALNIALNKISGEWDFPLLKDLLLELDGEIDLDITGFDVSEIDALFQTEKEIIEDEVPEPPEEPITKPGDLWLLGRHRLLCGDATVQTDVDRLMDGVMANISFTSPPYNAGALNIPGQETTKNKYNNFDDNMTPDDYLQFIAVNMEILLSVSDEVFYNIGLVEDNKKTIVDLLATFKSNFKDIIYWRKSTCAPHIQKGVINNVVEFILCFGDGRRKFKNATFSQGTYWNVIEGKNASGNEYAGIHKATFPVYLPANIIENFTGSNGIVLDCFGGTGTTLIAAEQLNRICYTMELDPKYCDVIVTRWENLTGQKAELEVK